MSILFLLAWAGAMLLLAWWLCGTWLNHLSIYTFVWTASLGGYELHWIRYNSIIPEAWLYIFLAWVGIYLGTAVVMFRGNRPATLQVADSLPRLRFVIILFSVAGFASCIVLARQIMSEVDSNLLVAITVGAPKIYAANFDETGIFVGIPYLGFLPFAACALSGAYTALKGRIDWVSMLPLSVATITGILSASRWSILLSVVLFLLALYITPKSKPFHTSRIQKVLLGLACMTGIIFVSIVRTDLTSSLTEQSVALNNISEWVPVAPSLYFYVSGPPVGFSEYLRDPGLEGNLPWGRYTFASIHRFLSKLDLTTNVPFHQDFYNTPEPINTCTYLREVYSDFGPAGMFIFPLVLGMTAGWLTSSTGTLFRIMLLTHIYILILFSYTNLVMSAGQWFQSLAFSLLASVFLDRLSHSVAVKRLAGAIPRPAS